MTQTLTEQVTSSSAKPCIIIPEPNDAQAGHKLCTLMATIVDSYRNNRIATLTDGVQNLTDITGRVICSFHTRAADAERYAPPHVRDEVLLTVWTYCEIQRLGKNTVGSVYTFLRSGKAGTWERIGVSQEQRYIDHATWKEALLHLLDHLEKSFLHLAMDTTQLQEKNMEIRRQVRRFERIQS